MLVYLLILIKLNVYVLSLATSDISKYIKLTFINLNMERISFENKTLQFP